MLKPDRDILFRKFGGWEWEYEWADTKRENRGKRELSWFYFEKEMLCEFVDLTIAQISSRKNTEKVTFSHVFSTKKSSQNYFVSNHSSVVVLIVCGDRHISFLSCM